MIKTPLAVIARYIPIGLLAGAQIALMVIAPSVAPSALAARFGPGAGPAAAGTAQTGTTTTGPAVNGPAGAGAAAGGGGAGGPVAVANSGDVTHCVAGREFDPSIAWFAPPCEPGTPAAPDLQNGGATWQLGVTGNQIEIVNYITNYGAEINAILQAQGALVTYNEASKLDTAVQNFLNKYFVLWGRKVHIDAYQGQCNFQDDNCILPEIDSVVQRYHPYMVLWQTPVCPECFAELAHDGAIGIGGLSFSADFAEANTPFFYDVGMSSTQLLENWAEWWCSSMSSVNDPSRRVAYSSNQNSGQAMNGQKRVLGFITPNKPDDENAVTGFLYGRLQQLCGEDPSTFHHYFYAQDINTAAQQVSATMAAMDTTTNYATDVLCVCDIVAPEFLYQGEADNNYWPENMIADTQGMGVDVYAQNYDVGPSGGGISCPGNDPPNCSFDSAIGLTVSPPAEPQNADPGTRVWHIGCGCNDALPSDGSQHLTGQGASDLVSEFVMMGALIENSGPQLDPWTMAKMALKMPAVGGGQYPLLKFSDSGYNPWRWTQQSRIAWWDPARVSRYNNVKGSWVSYPNADSWLGQGGFPSEPGGPNIPPANRRTS